MDSPSIKYPANAEHVGKIQHRKKSDEKILTENYDIEFNEFRQIIKNDFKEIKFFKQKKNFVYEKPAKKIPGLRRQTLLPRPN